MNYFHTGFVITYAKLESATPSSQFHFLSNNSRTRMMPRIVFLFRSKKSEEQNVSQEINTKKSPARNWVQLLQKGF